MPLVQIETRYLYLKCEHFEPDRSAVELLKKTSQLSELNPPPLVRCRQCLHPLNQPAGELGSYRLFSQLELDH